MDLRPSEIRVLGCLMEKQRTTPDAYPLSLNALRLACNQSTNRDPVVNYDDDVIRDATTRLQRRGLTRLASGAGSRSAKFRHLLAERLPMDDGEHAVMCVLMLRGAQTPGELKQRTERMHVFGDLDAVEATLLRLIDRELVQQLPRRPGQKEERYEHLLGEDSEVAVSATSSAPTGVRPEAPPPSSLGERPFVATPATAADGGDAAAPPLPGGGPTLPASPDRHVPDATPADGALATLQARVERLEREVSELREALGG